MPKPEGAVSDLALPPATIRPIGVYALSGLATDGAQLLSVDTVRGYLVQIDPQTNDTRILNPHHVPDWIGVTGLTRWENTFWFAKGQEVLWCDRHTLIPTIFTRLPYPVTGVADLWRDGICELSEVRLYPCVRAQYGQSRSSSCPSLELVVKTIAIHDDVLWVCDRAEQTVYCLDRTTGAIRLSALTPFSSPTGIAFYDPGTGEQPTCYVAYADEEPYIRDDPNAKFPYQLTFRDRTFIHPLYHPPRSRSDTILSPTVLRSNYPTSKNCSPSKPSPSTKLSGGSPYHPTPSARKCDRSNPSVVIIQSKNKTVKK